MTDLGIVGDKGICIQSIKTTHLNHPMSFLQKSLFEATQYQNKNTSLICKTSSILAAISTSLQRFSREWQTCCFWDKTKVGTTFPGTGHRAICQAAKKDESLRAGDAGDAETSSFSTAALAPKE